jgi:hypothetical protein
MVILKMKLSKGLVEELGETVEQVPTSMGVDVVVAVIGALSPSLTIVTTSLFSPDAFRQALRRWCKRTEEPVRFVGEFGRNKISIDLDNRTASEMAAEVSEIVAKFIATHPSEAARSTSKTP